VARFFAEAAVSLSEITSQRSSVLKAGRRGVLSGVHHGD
jgi:hypothetical protein